MSGSDLIAAERQRQIESEGWTPDHDDGHEDEGLAYVAAWLAAPHSAEVFVDYGRDKELPPSYTYKKLFLPDWGVAQKPMARVEALTKAGALIAAEIDRRLRAGGREAPMTLDEHAERCQVCVPHSRTECDFGEPNVTPEGDRSTMSGQEDERRSP